MKITNKKILLVLIFLSLTFQTYSEEKPVINLRNLDSTNYFSIYDVDTDFEIMCFLTGESTRFSDDPQNETNLGKFVELKHKVVHQKDKEIIDEEFYSVYGMLGTLNINYEGKVDRYIRIGTPGGTGPISQIRNGTFLLGVWSYDKTDYLVNYFGSEPIFMEGVYWYNPQKLLER